MCVHDKREGGGVCSLEHEHSLRPVGGGLMRGGGQRHGVLRTEARAEVGFEPEHYSVAWRPGCRSCLAEVQHELRCEVGVPS